MCRYCDYNSTDCKIFVDTLDNTFYLDYETTFWDTWDDDFIHERIYIDYCPWCGEKLNKNIQNS